MLFTKRIISLILSNFLNPILSAMVVENFNLFVRLYKPKGRFFWYAFVAISK